MCAAQAARGARRRRAQEEGAPASKLSPGCDALVRLAEPGDVYAHYNTAMSAAAVSTQIKAMEQRLGLKVRMACPHHLQVCMMHVHAALYAQSHSRSFWQCCMARTPANMLVQKRSAFQTTANNPEGGKQTSGSITMEHCVQEGTLTPKEAGVGMLTLTGWSAALGVLSLIAVVLGGAILGYWKYKGYDKMTAYTRVSKADRASSSTS